MTGHVWLAEVLSWCAFLAAGYGLLWWWLTTEGNAVWRACVLLPTVFLMPTHAKYYFVFFPVLLLVLLGYGPQATDEPARWRVWLLAGVVAGVAGQFRIELGLALKVAGGIFLGWDDVRARRFPRPAAVFVAGATAIVAGYFLLLICRAGQFSAPIRFIHCGSDTSKLASAWLGERV